MNSAIVVVTPAAASSATSETLGIPMATAAAVVAGWIVVLTALALWREMAGEL